MSRVSRASLLLLVAVHAGYGREAQQQGELTTGGLVKALGEHVGRPMKLRVLRPHGEVVELTITALDSGGGGGSLHHHHH